MLCARLVKGLIPSNLKYPNVPPSLVTEKRYEFLPHTADAYIAAYGETLEEAFESAALAMYEVMVDTSRVEPKVAKEVEVRGFDLESLLYNWLEELLFYTDSERLVFSKFRVREIAREDGEYVLRAEVSGEGVDPEKHELRSEVKAITYSLMEIKKEGGKYVLKFVLDL